MKNKEKFKEDYLSTIKTFAFKVHFRKDINKKSKESISQISKYQKYFQREFLPKIMRGTVRNIIFFRFNRRIAYF